MKTNIENLKSIIKKCKEDRRYWCDLMITSEKGTALKEIAEDSCVHIQTTIERFEELIKRLGECNER